MALEEIPPGAIIEFDYILPVDDDTCRRQIAHTMECGIPQAIQRRPITIIANGPSSRNAPIKYHKGTTLAVNGAMQLFLDHGRAPTYWAACDPQELVADFLPEKPPSETVYLIASKCHPKVFERLKGQNVWTWHVGDQPVPGEYRIPQACSITISASWLMHKLGFTDFEYWGWDGCFMDGKHHAASEASWENVQVLNLNYGGEIKDGEVIGGRTFSTTKSWAAEARSAEQFFQLAEYFDIGVKINGDGMFACAQQSLKAA